ncbi:Galectin [Caenorhabditis elegans]|uniref:Galectin n=1 Tax=Caenorhabditis elegans TaxID=6239 RepID=Q9GZD9_CAEEL|nr:Galectin [Caenorhabditis elegans]CCD66752.1 Galectin [Caenorhabditis elegans]|eukprot:NP_500491.1 Galectin [Caenorhabditis elegans]
MRLLHVLLLFTFLVVVSGILFDNGGRSHGFGSSSDSSDDYSGRRGGGRHRPPRPPRPSKPVTTPKPRDDWITINGPFTTTLPIPGGYWDTGKIMRIYGIPGSGRWTINLAKSKVWVFHFAVEPSKGLVARTRHLNGKWQVGETYGGNPFRANAAFNVTMVNQPTHIEIHVNGAFFVNFNHRVSNPSRDYLSISNSFLSRKWSFHDNFNKEFCCIW